MVDSSNYGRLLDLYRVDQELYEQVAKGLEERIRNVLLQMGSKARVTSRAKELSSLLRKSMQAKYENPEEEIHDRAAARVIVSFEYQVMDVVKALKATFEVIGEENKSENRPIDKLGYLGYHLDVKLRKGDLSGDFNYEGRICEIQVHTQAQTAWADIDHNLRYKTGLDPERQVQRSLLRLVALVEIFDSESNRSRAAITSMDGYEDARMIEELESIFIPLSGRLSDHNFSLFVLPFLRPLYDDDLDVVSLIKVFADAHDQDLRRIYTKYREDSRCDPLLHQPESLIVFERLNSDTFSVQARWPQELSEQTLIAMASIWGSALT